MKAARYHESGDPDVLTIDQIPKPEPAADEVLVEVHAASINPTDAKTRARGGVPLPNTTGSDFAGVVRAVGAYVTTFDRGDRVFGTGLHTSRFQQGSFAEFVSVPTDILAPLPDTIDYERGAALALVGVTAWRALIDIARIGPTERCLVHGGSGGVGHVAVQIARIAGARVIATAGSADGRRRIRELADAATIDYDTPVFETAVLDATGGPPDVVLNHRFGEYIQHDIDTSAHEGRIVVIAGDQGTIEDASPARGKDLSVSFMSMSNLVLRKSEPTISAVLSKLAALVVNDGLTVDVAERYALEEAGAVHRAMMQDDFFGKLVVLP